MIHYTELRAAFVDCMKMVDRDKFKLDGRLSELDILLRGVNEQIEVETPELSERELAQVEFYRAKRHQLLYEYVAVENTKQKAFETNRVASLLQTVNDKLYQLTRNPIYRTSKSLQAI